MCDRRYRAICKGIRHRGKASATPKLSSLAKTHKKAKERGVDLFPALAMEIKLRTTSKVVAGLAHGKVSKATIRLWKLMAYNSLESKPLLQEGRISITFSLTVDCHRSKSTHPLSQSCSSPSPRRHRFCSYPALQKHAMGEEDTIKLNRTRIGPASIHFSYTLSQSTPSQIIDTPSSKNITDSNTPDQTASKSSMQSKPPT